MNILRRPFAEKAYGIPPGQAIGRSGKLRFELRDSKPVLTTLPEVNFYDDEAAKPIAIQNFLGRRPTAAFCNCERDLQMLQWSCDTIDDRNGGGCGECGRIDPCRPDSCRRPGHPGELRKSRGKVERSEERCKTHSC